MLVTVRVMGSGKATAVKVQDSLDCRPKNLSSDWCLVNNGCSIAPDFVLCLQKQIYLAPFERKINQNFTMGVVITFFVQQSSLSL